MTEKGIDPFRISAATSQTDGQMVQNYLVPAGANFEQDDVARRYVSRPWRFYTQAQGGQQGSALF